MFICEMKHNIFFSQCLNLSSSSKNHMKQLHLEWNTWTVYMLNIIHMALLHLVFHVITCGWFTCGWTHKFTFEMKLGLFIFACPCLWLCSDTMITCTYMYEHMAYISSIWPRSPAIVCSGTRSGAFIAPLREINLPPIRPLNKRVFRNQHMWILQTCDIKKHMWLSTCEFTWYISVRVTSKACRSTRQRELDSDWRQEWYRMQLGNSMGRLFSKCHLHSMSNAIRQHPSRINNQGTLCGSFCQLRSTWW